MRPTAKFSISFGLVTIPVAAYNATDSSASVSFVRIHTADGGRVRNQPVCSLEGNEIPRMRSAAATVPATVRPSYRSATRIWTRCRCRPPRH